MFHMIARLLQEASSNVFHRVSRERRTSPPPPVAPSPQPRQAPDQSRHRHHTPPAKPRSRRCIRRYRPLVPHIIPRQTSSVKQCCSHQLSPPCSSLLGSPRRQPFMKNATQPRTQLSTSSPPAPSTKTKGRTGSRQAVGRPGQPPRPCPPYSSLRPKNIGRGCQEVTTKAPAGREASLPDPPPSHTGHLPSGKEKAPSQSLFNQTSGIPPLLPPHHFQPFEQPVSSHSGQPPASVASTETPEDPRTLSSLWEEDPRHPLTSQRFSSPHRLKPPLNKDDTSKGPL